MGQSNWVYFGGGRPGTIPKGTDESTADITVYENVAAMIETDGKTGQLPITNLIKLENTWKVLDLPSDTVAPLLTLGTQAAKTSEPLADAPSEEIQKLMDDLAKLDQLPNPSPEQIKRKCDILDLLAEKSKPGEDRAGWYRQLADTLARPSRLAPIRPAWSEWLGCRKKWPARTTRI